MRFISSCALVLATAATLVAQTAPAPAASASPGTSALVRAAVAADGLVYVGTVAGRGPDAKAQTAHALDTIAATLKAQGSTLANTANVMVVLRNTADFTALNEVFAKYWPADPPARTTIFVEQPQAMVGPDTLVQLSVVAIPAGGERVVVLPGGWMKPASPYSYGIKSGNTLFLAGLINRSGRDGATIPGDIAAQTKLVMENGAAILQAAGMSLSDVVSSRIFLSDPADFQNMNAAYRPFFPSAPPARATVKAGLPAGAAIEVSMVAVKDASRTAVIPPNADGTPGRAGGNLSPAIQVGKRLYVAGMTGGTQTNTGDVKAQTTEVLARLGRTLKAAGYDWSHVVEEIGYLPEVSRTPEMDAARRDVYSTNYPARVLLGTPLMGGNSIVEIMLTAVK